MILGENSKQRKCPPIVSIRKISPNATDRLVTLRRPKEIVATSAKCSANGNDSARAFVKDNSLVNPKSKARPLAMFSMALFGSHITTLCEVLTGDFW